MRSSFSITLCMYIHLCLCVYAKVRRQMLFVRMCVYVLKSVHVDHRKERWKFVDQFNFPSEYETWCSGRFRLNRYLFTIEVYTLIPSPSQEIFLFYYCSFFFYLHPFAKKYIYTPVKFPNTISAAACKRVISKNVSKELTIGKSNL